MSNSRVHELEAENAKLRKALSGLIPWAGEAANGPASATPEAKRRNKAMCEQAIKEACDCFPEGYNALREQLESN